MCGGGLGKTLLSAALPILGTLVAPGIGTALGSSLSGAALGGIGGAVGGAAGGYSNSGNLAGTLKGAAMGGAGGYLSSGGASDLIGGTAAGRALGLSNPEGGSVIGNAIGSNPYTGVGSFASGLSGAGSAPLPFSSGASEFTNAPGVSLPTNLSGAGESASNSGIFGTGASALAGGSPPIMAGGGSSSFGGMGGVQGIGTLLGAASSMNANDQAQKDLLKAQQQSLGVMQPYLDSGTGANTKLSSFLGTNGSPASSADILASSPGYQFQLQQGNQALDRQQAARGNYFSGAAIKEGQQFGQGLADQTANQYYSQLAQQAGQGQNAAGSAGNIFQNAGNAKANANIASSGVLNQTLSSLLGSGSKQPYVMPNGQIGYR